MGRRPGRYYVYYSVYNRKTDAPVFIHGTMPECIAVMRVKPATFYHYLVRNRKGTKCKYDIFKDDTEEVDENGN